MAAGCRGPAAPGRGGLQAIDVAEARRQARLHDAGQQVLKNDVDGCRHRYQWRVGKRRHAHDPRSTVRAHAARVTFSKGYVARDRTDKCIGAGSLSASTDPPTNPGPATARQAPQGQGCGSRCRNRSPTTENAATGYRKSGFPGRQSAATSPERTYRQLQRGRTPRRRCRTLVNW